LAAFDRGRIKVLVATDIVARGIDVEGISHVINYDLPNDKESYVHRIGRTARAGAEGIALSFCAAEEVAILRSIERLTGVPLTIVSRGARAEYQDSNGDNGQGAAKRQRGGEGKPSNTAKPRRSGNGNRRDGPHGTSMLGPAANARRDANANSQKRTGMRGEEASRQRLFGRRTRAAQTTR
jgi:ATP-dependent RNA helicase RhlE